MRAPLVIGNWKMHGNRDAVTRLLGALRHGLPASVSTAVCPPYPYLELGRQLLEGTHIALGAQDVATHAQGAWTGEVAAPMLADLGCRYVLVGHSERRQHFGDTDAVVAEKYAAALEAGLVPVLCVGEREHERDAGATQAVVVRQLGAVTARCGTPAVARGVIAYEPVWAIGTGRTATPEQAQEVHAALRAQLGPEGKHTLLLYGGSVKADNAAALFALPDVDGGLIGGASLVADQFAAICRAAVQ